MRRFYVYILASKSRNLYVGVTNNLERRVWQHLHDWSAFTARYRVYRLVYFETLPHPMQAINREKQIKAWRREKRVKLIESMNPAWDDLADGWFERSSDEPEDQA